MNEPRSSQRAAAFVRGALLSGAGLVLVVQACQPQDVYFYEPETLNVSVSDGGTAGSVATSPPVADAGDVPPRETPADSDEPAAPTQPACESDACELCVEQDTCAGSALPFCHPVGGHCVAACDASLGDAPGNCPGTARCDVASALCAECLGRDDCQAPTSACDVPSGVCVGCIDAADCAPTGQVCDSDAQQCVECVVDDDCAATVEICRESVSRCAECETDADCRRRGELIDEDDELRCSPDLSCVECITDEDCAVSEPDKPFCVRSECEDDLDSDSDD